MAFNYFLCLGIIKGTQNIMFFSFESLYFIGKEKQENEID